MTQARLSDLLLLLEVLLEESGIESKTVSGRAGPHNPITGMAAVSAAPPPIYGFGLLLGSLKTKVRGQEMLKHCEALTLRLI